VSGGQIADLAGAAGEAPSGTIKGQRRAWFAEAGGFVDATVYDRDGLAANTAIAGPALIEDSGSTLLIGPAATAQVMPSGSIVVELR
jgi:N-methylhydantoinase A